MSANRPTGRDLLPQPWEAAGVPRARFMALADSMESAGKRLVVETWVDGYIDPPGERDSWVVDWFDYSDYRTGEHISGFNPFETDPTIGRQGMFVVERRLAQRQ